MPAKLGSSDFQDAKKEAIAKLCWMECKLYSAYTAQGSLFVRPIVQSVLMEQSCIMFRAELDVLPHLFSLSHNPTWGLVHGLEQALQNFANHATNPFCFGCLERKSRERVQHPRAVYS